jgi:UTP--glucose-1-phosphate uridylyltransferase
MAILMASIDPDAWYPMATFERFGLGILREIAHGQLEGVRMWGRFQLDPVCKRYPMLVAKGDPRDSMMRFGVLADSFFDCGALAVVSVEDDHAVVAIDYGMSAAAEETASYQSLGFFERLVEVSGGKNVDARFKTKAWEGAKKTLLDVHWELEKALEAKGDTLRLARVRKATGLGNIHYVRQGEPLGLGHAVLCAADHVGNNPFAVLLGDDLIDERDHLLEAMIAVREAKGGSVIALMEVPPETIQMYGCAAVEPGSPDDGDGCVVRVTGLVEKPDPGDAPSNLAVIGRYILDPSIFEILARTPPGRGNEIQLTDALQECARSSAPGGGVHGLIFRGRRYDTGDRLDYLKAVVRLAVDHRELGADFSSWLNGFVAERSAGASEGVQR